MLTDKQKAGQKKYEQESLPNHIAWIVFTIIIIICLLADNL
jgi:hypothetical protein